MTIRFAAATSSAFAARRLSPYEPSAQTLIAQSIQRVANDNGLPACTRALSDQVLRAALEHFAEHGLGAARSARAKAEAASKANDHQAFDWWLGITRTLDRRMGYEVERLAPEPA
ncbi:MAG: hypothetical protein AAF251_17945 [Pseudomonadota bacterium]